MFLTAPVRDTSFDYVILIFLRMFLGVPYYLENKPEWLSAFATRLSDFATWRSHSATPAYFLNNTVRAFVWMISAIPGVDQRTTCPRFPCGEFRPKDL
jgi:hypothetical protein